MISPTSLPDIPIIAYYQYPIKYQDLFTFKCPAKDTHILKTPRIFHLMVKP